MRSAGKQVVDELGAHGLRDVGRTMARLRERCPDRMDFGKASGVVPDLAGLRLGGAAVAAVNRKTPRIPVPGGCSGQCPAIPAFGGL